MVALLLLLPAPAEGATRSCRVNGSETQAQNRHARLYESRGDLYACLRATGRRFRLEDAYDDGYVTSSSWTSARLGGRFAAWIGTWSDVSCKADCPPGYEVTRSSIVVYDLRRRRIAQTVSGNFPFVLTDRGALAWLVAREGATELHTSVPGSGQRAAAAGAIDPASLRAYHSLVLWRQDGAAHWAMPGA